MGANSTIDLAIFPMGGAASRMLPLSYGMGKGLLAIGRQTLLHRAMKEAAVAGAERFVFVLDRGSPLLPYFLERNPERLLPDCGMDENSRAAAEEYLGLLERVVAVVPMRVDMPGGLASAIASVEMIVAGERRFAVLSVDDIIFDPQRGLAAVAEAAARHSTWAVGVTELEKELFSEFGVVQTASRGDGTLAITSAQEKPGDKTNYEGQGIVGRYVFDASVFDRIRESQTLVVSENSQAGFHVTEALNLAAGHGQLIGVQIESPYFHAGTMRGYLAAWRHWLAEN